VAWFIFAPLFVIGIAWYVMNPEERTRFIQVALATIRRVITEATRHRPELDPFHEALRARTRRVVVTPAIVAAITAIFVLRLFAAGSLNDPEALISWGASVGPRTSNGEWWRLATTTLVHAGLLHLLVNIIGLTQLGLILERLIGPLAVAGGFIAAGAFAGLFSLAGHPLAISAGASGAIFGIYGLAVPSLILCLLPSAPIRVPLLALKRLAPAAAVFILYHHHVITGGEWSAELVGFVVGLVWGIVLSIRVGQQKPSGRRVAVAAIAASVIVIAFAMPRRGILDARPELERIVALEDRTASTYQKAVDKFKRGRARTEALTELINTTIMPELQAARSRLNGLVGVPREQQPLVASAGEYLRLRDQSWRLRIEGLRKENLATLQEAEKSERTSLEALNRIRPDLAASGENPSE
jgi:membrane associated rhomboid family serine protease